MTAVNKSSHLFKGVYKTNRDVIEFWQFKLYGLSGAPDNFFRKIISPGMQIILFRAKHFVFKVTVFADKFIILYLNGQNNVILRIITYQNIVQHENILTYEITPL